jgi:hypothetical protein
MAYSGAAGVAWVGWFVALGITMLAYAHGTDPPEWLPEFLVFRPWCLVDLASTKAFVDTISKK